MYRDGWTLVPGTGNWLSKDGHYIAIYHHSYRGLARYWVYLLTTPPRKRMEKTSIYQGSLPHPDQLIPVLA